MSIYLDTRSNAVMAIAICGRCSMKFPWGDLMSDPNSPGLRVCEDCLDELDPYRLPAAMTENISLAWARPDESVATSPQGLITEEGDRFLITEDGDGYLDT